VRAGPTPGRGRPAAEAKGGRGKPVIAINAAIVWHAYRANGFEDRIYGCGSLLSDH
ncbi:MAG: arylmalonate decarboxylase, partial [Acidobacteria bacterium]|nr:arylmalonate decarboxylase [Acidobacteriota bacterium]